MSHTRFWLLDLDRDGDAVELAEVLARSDGIVGPVWCLAWFVFAGRDERVDCIDPVFDPVVKRTHDIHR